MTSIWWIRRDLRLDDNVALGAASADGPVVPVFVVDPIFLKHSGVPRLQFLFGTLRELDARMGGALVIRVGDPATEIAAVAQAVGAKTVFAHRDFVPYGQSRDIKVAAVLQSIGVHFVGADSPYVVDPGTIRKDDGTPVRVFTPFFKRWQQVSWKSSPSYVPQWSNTTSLSVALPEIATTEAVLPGVGQGAARERDRREVDQLHEIVADVALRDPRPAHDQRHVRALVVEKLFSARVADPVVRRKNHQRLLQNPFPLQPRNHVADVLVREAHRIEIRRPIAQQYRITRVIRRQRHLCRIRRRPEFRFRPRRERLGRRIVAAAEFAAG